MTTQAPDYEALLKDALDRIHQLEAMQPKFTKMQVAPKKKRSYKAPEELAVAVARRTKLGKGQSASGQTKWFDTPEGRATIPEEYWPLFSPGDIVVLNPNAQVWGGEGRTWGEILGEKVHQVSGEILGTMYLTETWEPKYKVAMPGVGSGQGATIGLRESELLPYEE